MELFPNAILTEENETSFKNNNTRLAIEATGIYKSFGSKKVLENLNFNLPEGKIYAICGNNGTGKSVFLRIITGLIYPDQGQVVVNGQVIGKDVEFPVSVGSLIDHPGFLLAESAYRNLEILAMISGKADKQSIQDTMAFVGLDPYEKKPVRTYSVGMRQRLGLAQAIMEDPKLLILDEPTAGLDFDAQKEIYDFLIQLRQQGKTILITSHSLAEVKLLCDKAFQIQNRILEEMSDIDSTTAER